MKGWKKFLRIGLILILLILIVLTILVGLLGGLGPLSFLRDLMVSRHQGNSKEYHLENVEPLADSPLQGMRIAFLGSSVTQGSSSMGVSMADYIGVRNHCTVIKEALVGTTLADKGKSSYIQRMQRRLSPDDHFDLFVCQLSTNDASRKVPLGAISSSRQKEEFDTKTVAGAMEFIIVYVQETWDCPLVFYTNTHYDNEPYHHMVDLLSGLEEKWGMGVIDLWNDPEMRNLPQADYNLYMYDEVHPTQAGYLEWWTPVMEDYLYTFVKTR